MLMLKRIILLSVIFCTAFISSVWGQNIKLAGTVVDDRNEPLPGVTIVVKGGSQNTMSDLDGIFHIDVAPQQTLVFSLVGMTPQEIAYTGQKSLKVVMKTDDKLLEEVVVIGYQTIKKADLTGAVSVFNTSEMKNKTVTGTVGDALGTLPGVFVRTAGNPGAEGKVEIRGTGTFGDSNPLYVVDGIVSGANRDFNFNDIESIQVLKDASAAAIYGSRAGNGVIIITTKQGKEGPMKIDLSSQMTVQWLPKYNLVGRDRWIELNDMAFANGGKAPANHFDGNTDWQNEVFKTGIVQDHNISISGGGKTNRYFLSGNLQSNNGTTIGTDSKRFTLRSNMTSSRDFGDAVTFRIGENMVLSHYRVNELNTNPIVDVYRMLPTISVHDPNNDAKGGYGFGDGSRDVTFGTNPFAKEDFENTTNSNLRVRGNAFTELEVLKMFKYKFNFGFDFSNDKHKYLRKEGYWTYNQPYDPSSLNRNQAQSRNLVFDNTLEFNKEFGKHSVSAVVGTSYQASNYEQLWGTKNDVLMSGDSYFDQLDAALSGPKTGSYRNQEKLFSVFGRANYNFDDKYLFSFTMRRDESSKFNPKNNVGYFPSFSAGWRISKEKFFNVTWVDDLKIRGNYGRLGTSNNGKYDYIPLIGVFPQVVFGNDNLENAMTQIKLVNENLKWEILTQVNLGFDAAFLNSRLGVSAEYFIKDSKDVLTEMPILLSTGNNGGNPWVNAATLKNTGFEVTLSWRDKVGKDFDYNITTNFSYLKNRIDKLAYGLDEINQWDTKSKVGRSIGEWFLIKTDGLFRSEEEVLAHKNSKGQLIQPNAKPGDIRYIDFNDDGQITDADRQYCGNTMPKFQMGINMGFRYKDIDLQIQMAGSFGNKLFNGPRSGYDMFNDNSGYRKDYDPWTPENPNAKDPRPIYGDSRNSRGDQDRWLENGNYWRVKQIALGYNLPKSLTRNFFDNIRVYVNAQNLITFTSYKGLDPEFLNTNIWDRTYDGGAFPNPRGITFGAQLAF